MSPPIRPPRRATHERSPAQSAAVARPGTAVPSGGGRRERTGASLLAGCDATGSVRSEVRGLDVARCLPAGRCGAVLSHLSDRQGSPAGRGGEKGLRRLRCPRELPVLRPGDHAGGHLGRNHCGRATCSTQGIPRPGQRAVPRRAKRGGDRRTRGSDRARGRAAGHVRQDRVMSLPAGQRRALNRIGKHWRTTISTSGSCSLSLPGWPTASRCPRLSASRPCHGGDGGYGGCGRYW